MEGGKHKIIHGKIRRSENVIFNQINILLLALNMYTYHVLSLLTDPKKGSRPILMHNP